MMVTRTMVLIFGASGMVGGGVLAACLAAPAVPAVTALARRPPSVELRREPQKLRVVLHENFLDYSSAADAFAGIDLCLFCLGISASQVKNEAEYRRITLEYPLAAARMLKAQSPNAAFHYVSGAGADLKSRFMWARVKAEAEQQLIAEIGALCLRPGAIGGKPSDRTAPWIRALLPLTALFSPIRSLYVKSEDVGKAMLVAHRESLRSRIIDNRQIRDLADRY